MPALSRKLIAILILGAVLVLLLLGSLSRCTQLVTAKKEARVAKGQAEAAADAGAEAMNIVGNVEAADRSADRIHEEGLDAIRKAPEGKSGAAAVDHVCRLRLYRDSQRCAAVRTARPGEPARAD